MNIGAILLLSIILFAIIFFAVRLAINPLLSNQKETIIDDWDSGLVKLRDIGVFSVAEHYEVMKLYQNKSLKEKQYEEFNKFSKVLKELKDMGYFDEEEYSIKNNKLKEYFKISI